MNYKEIALVILALPFALGFIVFFGGISICLAAHTVDKIFGYDKKKVVKKNDRRTRKHS